ncbi:hypothetical protein B484DRAFT_128170 [Ochromonadaceae sp. CCMP2298]|nr:hypothetical protein B484DRAFT_128170 [Ochromonadaceae sp. CCMP2298]
MSDVSWNAVSSTDQEPEKAILMDDADLKMEEPPPRITLRVAAGILVTLVLSAALLCLVDLYFLTGGVETHRLAVQFQENGPNASAIMDITVRASPWLSSFEVSVRVCQSPQRCISSFVVLKRTVLLSLLIYLQSLSIYHCLIGHEIRVLGPVLRGPAACTPRGVHQHGRLPHRANQQPLQR